MGELLNLDPASVLLGFWLLEDHFPKNLGIFSFVQKKSKKKRLFPYRQNLARDCFKFLDFKLACLNKSHIFTFTQ